LSILWGCEVLIYYHQNEELPYCSPNEILFERPKTKDEIGWAYDTMEEKIGFAGF
jgi:hypothetical protein